MCTCSVHDSSKSLSTLGCACCFKECDLQFVTQIPSTFISLIAGFCFLIFVYDMYKFLFSFYK